MHGAAGRAGGWLGAVVVLVVLACLWVSAAAFSGAGVGVGAVPAAAAAAAAGQQRPVCRGLHRVEVDWWVMLKHPRGYQYSYLDSSSTAGGCDRGACWRHGALSMQNPNPVSHTLEVLPAAAAAAIAAAANSMAYVVYNDADPGGTEHFEYAHAKGVVAFSAVASNASSSNSSSSAAGFWLLHSAPRFPGVPGQRDWLQLQRPQTVFGQHFSCFSLAGNSSIAAVADALLAAGPYIYSSRLPASLAVAFPGWLRLQRGVFDRVPLAVSASLVSSAGQQLLVFAKSSALNVSLTDAVVGPGLGVSMFWETWRRSHDALASHCPSTQQQGVGVAGQRSSLNIDQVAFQGTRYSWGWAADHSKWGVSSSSSAASLQGSALLAVCLGDMNRAGWQAHRGGSYVCLQHTGLWEAFHGILAAAEPCMWHA